MELSDLAERWLYSDRLEDKLFWPEKLSDETPEFGNSLPELPSRPKNLLWSSKEERQRSPFPTRFDSEKARGQVLHFFANHELLALELMALALLKFPDAPKSFRQGLASTVKDEIQHMRFYLEKMKNFGVEFGEYPLNGFFWNSLSQMKSPFDFVVGMSLTFEQANLDFSLHYENEFRKVDDAETADTLRVVYEDEIRHVRHGLHWFEKWRDQNTSQWQAYRDHLQIPLSPQRAKGKIFDIAARKKVGLSKDFIENLRVYSHSKGRLPKIYSFDPEVEEAIHSWPKPYTLKPQLQSLKNDLSFIPAYLAHASDIVLVPKAPRLDFLQGLKDAGLNPPEIVEFNQKDKLQERKTAGFEPWGQLSDKKWIYSKAWSLSVLREYLEKSKEDFLISQRDLCKECCTIEEIEASLEEFSELGHRKFVLKGLYGASGRHFQHLEKTQLDTAVKNWCQKQIDKNQKVLVDPWLEKVFDYSLQITSDGKIHGKARFLNDRMGRYQGALLGGFTTGLASETKRFLNDDGKNNRKMDLHFAELAAFVAEKAQRDGYEGAIGIDAFVFRDFEGNLKVRPIVETNLRNNMGRLVVELEKKLARPGNGLWKILSRLEVQKMGFSSLADFHKEIESKLSPLTRNKTQKVEFLRMSEPVDNEFIAYLFWGPDLETLQVSLSQWGCFQI